ncbi:hypothetical protein [Sinorhizobium americanum]|uniref:hypothetical protein n=1 Tax=Sinorhizobium americanum TaxID=194963 RepID=UPI00104AC2C5|nr:hypothetical protein [Sinorhizobium americanum]
MAAYEQTLIEDALTRCGATREAADLLQTPQRTLNEKINRLGLRALEAHTAFDHRQRSMIPEFFPKRACRP